MAGEIELTEREANDVMLVAMMHFSRIRDMAGRRKKRGVSKAIKSLNCNECEDFITGSCKGEGLKGWECLSCMYRKIQEGEGGTIGIPPWIP